MDMLIRDLRHASRALWRERAFSTVTALTLALGIGATTAIFSVINGVLLRPLPYPSPDRIVQVLQVNDAGRRSAAVSEPNFLDLKEQSRTLGSLAQLAVLGTTSVLTPSGPVRATPAVVSREFFEVLGTQPIRGRLFVPEEQQQGGQPAVVVSHAFWERHLGGLPPTSDMTLTFNDRAYTVVGVMPPSFAYPVGVDIWAPRELGRPDPSRTAHNWQVIGRLADGVGLDQARSELSAISRQLKQVHGENTRMSDADLVPLQEAVSGRARPALLVLFAASTALLLIACANVANLLLARRAVRQGELAVRIALGAGRGRVIQQVLAESLVLSVAGGALGVPLAALGVRALLALEAGHLPRVSEIRVDVMALLFTLGVSILVAIALGLVTAWRATHGDVRDVLARSQRTQAGSSLGDRFRSTLVATQLAVTLVLLVGVGLLAQSFLRLLHVDPGFRTEQVVVLDISSERGDAETRRRLVQFYDELITRIRALPGVIEAGGVNAFPLTKRASSNGPFIVVNGPDEPQIRELQDLIPLLKDPARAGEAEYRLASGGYFRAMGIPLLRGRLFDERDQPDAPHAAIISASLANARWPGEDPIGRFVQFGAMDGDLRTFTIVGVVGDVRESSLDRGPQPTFYANYRQRPSKLETFNIAIRAEGDPAAIIAAARNIVHELRPDLPPRFRTIETIVSESVANPRFLLFVGGVFAAAAFLLAVLGVYSVFSFAVAQSRREIALRMALGARAQDVLRLVLRRGLSLALIGNVVGTLAALALTRLLEAFLFEITATDPVSFLTMIVVLTAVALAATYVPARRAAGADPMAALRDV